MSQEKVNANSNSETLRTIMKSRKIGIVGNGRYGKFLVDFFRKLGNEVQHSDIGSRPSNEVIAKWADVVIVAVTITETLKVISQLALLLKPSQLFMDVTSTKSNEVKAMLASKAEVVGLHPFCAPPVKRGTFKGQTIFVCRARLSEWRVWLEEFLVGTEASVQEITPEQHDLLRSVDQFLEHMCTILKFSVMRQMDINPNDILGVASPVYKLTAVQMARMFAQDATLYGGLAMSNPFASTALGLFVAELQKYSKAVERGNLADFRFMFKENTQHIGAGNIAKFFSLSEHLVSLMSDLSDSHSILVTIANDKPGILEIVGSFFRKAKINLTSIHSRPVGDKVEFFISFNRDKDVPAVVRVISRLEGELNATVVWQPAV